MKTPTLFAALFTLVSLVCPAVAQEVEAPILERYILGVGNNSDGVATVHYDKYFGNGTARASVTYFDRKPAADPTAESGVLVLGVARFVRAGEITFALLVFDIEIRGFDADGTLVYSSDLDGFTFGDSRSGRFTKTLRNIPATVSKLEVTFRGNYE